MMPEDLAILRRAYARQVLAAAGVTDPALERALAETARERFLGPGPWSIVRWGGRYRLTPTDDPVYLYTDDLVAIDAARNLNNGQPSFLASLIHAAGVRPGDHAVHVGTGTGYYTAILCHLAGSTGRVTGIEVDPGLAARCRANLPEAEIVTGDGGRSAFAPADVILVNAGAARPADLWLDRLKDGGRLVLPLTTDKGFTPPGAVMESTKPQGAVFVVTRQGCDFHAGRISATRIFPCAGLRDPGDERRLAAAFAGGDGSSVTRLHRRNAEPGEACWLAGDGWCMT
jgi:protein-L-isoaspartate(D-aspartate) O-methyltransferase